MIVVKDIMHDITKVPANLTISEVAKIMDKKILDSVLIEEKGKLVGIITERDILRKIVAKGKDPSQVKVEEIMSAPLITVDTKADIEDASEKMTENNIRRLVVTKNGKIVGIITAENIAKNIMYLTVRRIVESKYKF